MHVALTYNASYDLQFTVKYYINFSSLFLYFLWLKLCGSTLLYLSVEERVLLILDI